MRGLLQLLWLAGFVQVAIAFANLFLPAKLKYRENLSRVAPIIRQIFVVHSVYIVGVVLLFAAVTFGFAGELASGHGLGRFLATAIALFWLFRAPVQLLYYDATLREKNRWGDVAFTVGALDELTPYGHIDAPHLHGYFVSEKGQFLLTALPGGRTRLQGTTWYHNAMWPASYWHLWSDYIIHRIHSRVLEHIRTEAETENH